MEEKQNILVSSKSQTNYRQYIVKKAMFLKAFKGPLNIMLGSF